MILALKHLLLKGLPSSELKEGRATINLRLKPAKNGQKAGIKMATDYLDW
jgi:hypothetical protein